MKPSMTDAERDLFVRFLRQADIYTEFGAGGSTYMASQHVGNSVVTVDSSKEWLGKVFEACAATGECKVKPKLVYANIGPTGPWGRPADQSCRERWPAYYEAVWDLAPASIDADLYLVDGRFRVASFAQTILRCRPDSLIMIHDFSSRKQYHAAREVAREVARAEDLSVFVPIPGQSRRSVTALLERYRFEAD